MLGCLHGCTQVYGAHGLLTGNTLLHELARDKDVRLMRAATEAALQAAATGAALEEGRGCTAELCRCSTAGAGGWWECNTKNTTYTCAKARRFL